MPARRTNFGDCSVEGCSGPAEYRGFCAPHYTRVQRYGEPGGPIRYDFHRRTLIERVLGRVDTTDAAACWLWPGATINGYGVVRRPPADGPGNYYVHRVTWEDLHGPIPDGLTVDHLCLIRSCVNPLHLQLLTRAENARQGALRQNRARRHETASS